MKGSGHSFLPYEANNDDLENGTHVHRGPTCDWTALDFPVNFHRSQNKPKTLIIDQR